MDNGQIDPQQQAQMEALQTMLMQVAEAQEQLVGFTNKCFNKCVDSIDESLSSRQESCLTNCINTIVETSSFMAERLQVSAESQKEQF